MRFCLVSLFNYGSFRAVGKRRENASTEPKLRRLRWHKRYVAMMERVPETCLKISARK